MNIRRFHSHRFWQKVWYESYPEPAYVWQSTSANDDFEEKFSLTPITFGTIKAALFAMLFADTDSCVRCAIYTAYFMSPRMRRVVKPSIEVDGSFTYGDYRLLSWFMVCTYCRNPPHRGVLVNGSAAVKCIVGGVGLVL